MPVSRLDTAALHKYHTAITYAHSKRDVRGTVMRPDVQPPLPASHRRCMTVRIGRNADRGSAPGWSVTDRTLTLARS